MWQAGRVAAARGGPRTCHGGSGTARLASSSASVESIAAQCGMPMIRPHRGIRCTIGSARMGLAVSALWRAKKDIARRSEVDDGWAARSTSSTPRRSGEQNSTTKDAQRRRAFSATACGRRALVHLWVEDERRLKNEGARGADGDKEEELRPHDAARRAEVEATRSTRESILSAARSQIALRNKRPAPRGTSSRLFSHTMVQ